MAISSVLLSRFAVPTVGLASVAVVFTLYLQFPGLYELIIKLMIMWPLQIPFGDWVTVVAWINCWSQGVNVYVGNPCYPIPQVDGFDYSPLLLRLTFLRSGVTRINATMFSVIILFFLSLATLPPPNSLRNQAIRLLATISSAIWLALQTGNLDLILFIFVIVALNLRVLALPWRMAGYALIIFTGLLKFYPFVALIVVLRERVKVLVAVALSSVGALGALIAVYYEELNWAIGNLSRPDYFHLQFGSANLPVAVGVTVANILRVLPHYDNSSARAIGELITRGALPVLTVIAFMGAAALCQRWRLPSIFDQLSDRETGYLVAGAAIICGCFFIVNSTIFRGMFLLLTLPGLSVFSRTVAAPSGRRLFAIACCAIPFVLWKPFFDMCLFVASHWRSSAGTESDPYDAFPGFTVEYMLWVTTEVAWWYIIILLLASLGAFVQRSDVWTLHFRRTERRLDPNRNE
jgi:hypothetical protein